MSTHRCRVSWSPTTESFAYEAYDRTHTWTFGGGVSPRRLGPEELARMHEVSHRECFIASSVRTQVTVEPRDAGGDA